MALVCDLCGGPVDPDSRSNYVRVTGYDRKRAAGGQNQLVLREIVDPPRWAHDECVWRRQHNLPPVTWPTLFDSEEA